MRYRRAVEKLRLLAQGCQEIGSWPPWDEPYLVAMYAFGEVLDGADPLEAVQVAGVIRLPPEEVAWGSSPHGTEWLADRLRLSKGGYEFWWRSYLDPVWNHYIRSPVRIWSQDGIDEETLDALENRRLSDLRRLAPDPVDERLQLRDDLDTALNHLRQVHASYWDDQWRRDHRGMGRYPEHELWEAVEGYLDLLKAARQGQPADERLSRLLRPGRRAGRRSPADPGEHAGWHVPGLGKADRQQSGAADAVAAWRSGLDPRVPGGL